MPQAHDDLVARASDPNAELTTLHELANNYPGLRPYIAENPRTYPALLEWLGTLGDPAVDAALARRTASPVPSSYETVHMAPVRDTAPATQAAWTPQPVQPVPGPYQQPVQHTQAPYQQPPISGVPAQAGGAFTQAQPPAGQDGLFGVGEEDPEEDERSASGLLLWLLAAVVLVAVIALVVWFLSSKDEPSGTSEAPTAVASAAPQDDTPATEGSGDAGSAEPTPTPSPTATASAEIKAPAPADAIEMTSFSSPSGNIACTLSDDSVSCTINEHSFVGNDPSCNSTNSAPFTVTVGQSGEASGSCPTAPFTAAGATLNYGSSAKYGTVACTSSESGIDCWSQVTGQGFSLSRDEAMTNSR